jgi:hypothetical protein
MPACAVLIRFDARTGKEAEVEGLLRSLEPPGGSDASPRCWFALRMAPEIFGFFATFETDALRQVFLSGLAQGWNDRTSELLSRPPVTEQVEIVAQSGVPPVPPVLSMSAPTVESRSDNDRHPQVHEIPKVGSRDAPGG